MRRYSGRRAISKFESETRYGQHAAPKRRTIKKEACVCGCVPFASPSKRKHEEKLNTCSPPESRARGTSSFRGGPLCITVFSFFKRETMHERIHFSLHGGQLHISIFTFFHFFQKGDITRKDKSAKTHARARARTCCSCFLPASVAASPHWPTVPPPPRGDPAGPPACPPAVPAAVGVAAAAAMLPPCDPGRPDPLR